MEEEAAHISKGLPLLLREGPHLTVSIRRAGEVEGSFDDLGLGGVERPAEVPPPVQRSRQPCFRSEEHTSELQSLMRISYAVFCLKNKKHQTRHPRLN